MEKALYVYGTRKAGSCWHDCGFNVLKKMGFTHSKADPDVWMRKTEGNSWYEHIALYDDDLGISTKNPKKINDLQLKYHFKIKGTGPLTHHLGCTCIRHPDGTLVSDLTKYIEIMESYEHIFVHNPNSPGHHLKKSCTLQCYAMMSRSGNTRSSLDN